MRIVGKIFVTLVFIISLVLLAFALSVQSWSPQWREVALRPRSEVSPGKPLGLQFQLEDVQAAVAQKETEIEQLQAEIARVRMTEINSPYRRHIQKLQEDIDTLTADNNLVQAELTKLSTDVRSLAARSTSLQKDVSRRTNQLARLLVEVRGERQDTDEQFIQLVAAQDEKQGTTSTLENHEAYVRTVAQQIARDRTALVAHGHDPDAPPEGRPPRVQGVITGLGEQGLIEISLGSDDGLQSGHTVELYRGQKYLGRAEIVTVTNDKAVAKILRKYQKAALQKGDVVATRLRLG